ncbi:MAG TPA: hypothetical protein VF332_12545 [Vicinamibacterales bacterium]|jgi:hypothetical protein
MRPPLLRALLLIVPLAIAASGCNNNATVATPTPTPVQVTETFAGSLTPTGVNYHLLTAKVGDVVMTMTGIGPDPKVTIGMAIGVYSTLACTDVMDNPTSTIGSQLIGTTTATTGLCVKVYDGGTIAADTTLTYELTVTHY